MNANSTLLQERIVQQSALFAERTGDLAHANQQALGQIAGQIHVQAIVMTYSDCFWILGIGLIALLPIVLLLPQRIMLSQPKTPPGPGAKDEAVAGSA